MKYNILADDEFSTIYKVETLEEAIDLGKDTKWCISEENNSMFDDYINQGYTVLFLIEKQSFEKYGIILTPEKEYDEIVNANNNSLFYTNKFEEINKVLLKYRVI